MQHEQKRHEKNRKADDLPLKYYFEYHVIHGFTGLLECALSVSGTRETTNGDINMKSKLFIQFIHLSNPTYSRIARRASRISLCHLLQKIFGGKTHKDALQRPINR
jgi:hypothetical protein